MFLTRSPAHSAFPAVTSRFRKASGLLALMLALCAGPGAAQPAAPAAAAAAAEDDFAFSKFLDGYIRMRNYIPSGGSLDPEHIYEWRLKMPIRAREWLSGLVSSDARIDYSQDEVENEERRLDLYEAYGDFEWKSLKARLGRQVIRWGKGDEVNPLDNFTPEDFSEAINLDRAERKMPVWALYPRLGIGDKLWWEGLWIPRFQENRVADAGSRWEPYIARQYRSMGFTMLKDDPPDDAVWASRMVYQGGLGDVSLTYASHFEENPAYRVHPNPRFVPDGRTSPGEVETIWEPVQSVGSDFEVARNEWGYRGELVYTMGRPFLTYDRTDLDALVERDMFACLLGVDHTFADDYYLNIQLIQEYIPDYQDQMQQDEYEASVTFRFWKQMFRQKLRLQLTGRCYLTEPDYFCKVNGIYELGESFEIDAGYIVFEGRDEGLFGEFDGNDQLFINLKYSY